MPPIMPPDDILLNKAAIIERKYQELDGTILHWIAEDGWKDWVRLCNVLDVHIAGWEQL